MSVSELCQICESNEAEHTCEQCGRAVCLRHYDEAFGFCMDCVEGADSGGQQSDGPGRGDLGDGPQF
jgi:hypothetical protein